jgi:anaerobic ribonucleoside-triphosphate reductase activating protein
MRIADTTEDSIVDGPGLRFVVFTQGCPHRCPNCHNPQTHDYSGGSEITVEELFNRIKRNPLCGGLTLSGGEPFEQASECAELAKRVKALGLSVWTYTGYTLEELTGEDRQELLKYTDTLIDGKFIQAEKSFGVKWRGSANQRLWEQYEPGRWRTIGGSNAYRGRRSRNLA